ncbi:hypothetical protein [Enterobacter cloacae]|uniref:hypothetical protein n=1 Tax=Enterobacter cloacae TaxID=550 RepID=UPI00352B4FA4
MAVNVKYSQSFLSKMQTLNTNELVLIGNFITSLTQSGYIGLPGRNKPSTGVSRRHVNRIKLIQYALQNNLWHYHVGYAVYDKNRKFGDWTSQYVVHYQNNGTDARFVDYGSHPPFKLPKPHTLK